MGQTVYTQSSTVYTVIGVATGLLGVASNPSTLASNPNGNPNIGMLATSVFTLLQLTLRAGIQINLNNFLGESAILLFR